MAMEATVSHHQFPGKPGDTALEPLAPTDAYIGSGVTLWEQYSYVMIVETDPPGAPDTGYPFAGTDIDAVGAISSAPPVSDVPDGGSTGVLVGLALLGLAGVRRMR